MLLSTHLVTGGSPHEGPVTWKRFSCHDFIMVAQICHLCTWRSAGTMTTKLYVFMYLLRISMILCQHRPPCRHITGYITIHSMFGSYWSIYHIWPQYHLISMASGQYGAWDGHHWGRFWPPWKACCSYWYIHCSCLVCEWWFSYLHYA